MSARGTLRIARELVDHPLLQGGAFDRRSAWLWILSEAAWGARNKVIAGVSVPLSRGELAVSVRYLAKRWEWDLSRVRRFLERLTADNMIVKRVLREGAADVITVIRVVKFDRWQGHHTRHTPDTPPDTLTDTPPDNESVRIIKASLAVGSDTDTPSEPRCNGDPTQIHNQHKEEERKILRFRDSRKAQADSDGENTTAWPSEAFDRWYKLYPRKKAPKAARKAFEKLASSREVSLPDLLARTERYAAEVNSWPTDRRQFIPYPASWLNGGSYADEPDNAPTTQIAKPTRDPATFTDQEWLERLHSYGATRAWSSLWGARPGDPGCIVPAHLQIRAAGGGHE